LNAHRSEGALTTGDLVVDDVTYIDWYVRNEGPLPVTSRFFTDVYLDGMFVQRWSTRELGSGSYIGVADWSRLTDEFNIAPGDHTLRLVADATDLIAETDEADNVFERTFTWGGTVTAPAARSKQANLVPSPATDRVAALIASSYPDATGSDALTADARTFITWGLRNAGLASVANVSVHLYFDDIFVEGWVINGLLADGRTELVAWDDLSRTVSIAPGTHALRLVVDPGDMIAESYETDNLFEARLTWASGPPPPAESAPPPPPARPLAAQPSRSNLMPAIPYGWDAAIVAKSYAAAGTDAEGFDGPLSVEQPAFLSIMLRNASPVATGADFAVELFVDNESISVRSFNGTLDDAGSWWSDTFQLPAGSVSAGTHRIRMMIDSGGAVNEFDEVDNVLQRTFEWLPGPVPAPAPPVTYTEPEVDGLLERLSDLLLVAEHLRGPDAAETDWTPAVLDVATAAYYLATGVSLGDERLVIEILPGEEYDARHREQCFSMHVARSPEEYSTLAARCVETGESSTGLTLEAEGKILIMAREEETPAGVLNTLFHELGHARQRFLAPGQSEAAQSSALKGLQEAEAEVFAAVMWRTLEDRLEGRFLSYPTFALMEEYARNLIDTQVEKAALEEEHALGYVLLWLAALRDPAGLGLGDELRESGWLSTQTAKVFYDYLLSIAPESASGWADSLLNESEPFLAEYRAIALSRLVRGLSPSGEGHPALRKVAFLVP